LEHIKIIYGLQKENLIIYIASFTLLASLIGIFATIFVKWKYFYLSICFPECTLFVLTLQQ